MFEVPHMLAGEAVGKLLPRARYALPAAYLSHFLLDAIPHREITEIPGLTGQLKYTLEVIGLAAALALVIGLGWRHRQRWVMWGAAACAILPDLLDHVHPIADLWHRLPGTRVLAYLHNHIQTTSSGCPLLWGIAGEVVVIALTVWFLARRDRRKTPEAEA